MTDRPLTKRETEVYALLVGTELLQKQMGQHLGISDRTVNTHAENIYAKYGVASRTGLLHLIIAEKDRTIQEALGMLRELRNELSFGIRFR